MFIIIQNYHFYNSNSFIQHIQYLHYHSVSPNKQGNSVTILNYSSFVWLVDTQPLHISILQPRLVEVDMLFIFAEFLCLLELTVNILINIIILRLHPSTSSSSNIIILQCHHQHPTSSRSNIIIINQYHYASS